MVCTADMKFSSICLFIYIIYDVYLLEPFRADVAV